MDTLKDAKSIDDAVETVLDKKKKKKHKGPRKRRRRKKNNVDLDTAGNGNRGDTLTEAKAKATVIDTSMVGNDVTTSSAKRMSTVDPLKASGVIFHSKSDTEKKERKKKHKGPRKRRRKKKYVLGAKGDTKGTPTRSENLLTTAAAWSRGIQRVYVPRRGTPLYRSSRQYHNRQNMHNMYARGRWMQTPSMPTWFDPDRVHAAPASSNRSGGAHTNATNTFANAQVSKMSMFGVPIDQRSWLQRRAVAGNMGVTPIDTTAKSVKMTRLRRVASWGKHTTELDPIYDANRDEENKRKSSSGDRPIMPNDSEDRNKHFEQIFSPSWGAETEAWQRERLKQWVIWAEEQERANRVREMYSTDDKVVVQSNDPMDYEVVCPYISLGCTETVMRRDLRRHLAICEFRPVDAVCCSPVDVDDTYEVMCPYAFLGCTVSCSRDKIEAHINECEYRYEKRPKRRRESNISAKSQNSDQQVYNMHERYSMMLLQLSMEIVDFAAQCRENERHLQGIVDTAIRLIHQHARSLEGKQSKASTGDGNDRSRNIRTQAVLFGSRAMGLALPGSDIDIAVQLLVTETEKDCDGVVATDARKDGRKASDETARNTDEEVETSEDAATKESRRDSQVEDASLCVTWLRRLAETLQKGETQWLEWIKLIDTTAVPIIKLSALPRCLLEKARGNIYEQLQITNKERRSIGSIQVQMRQCMDRILSCGGLDLEATERISRLSSELASLQRGLLQRGRDILNSKRQTSLKSELPVTSERRGSETQSRFSSPTSPGTVVPSSPQQLSSAVQAITAAAEATGPIAIDITMTMHGGVEAVDLVRGLVRRFPELRPLVLVIKQLLSSQDGLNDPYRGGLGSYAIVIMVASLLQRREMQDSDDEDEDDAASSTTSTSSQARDTPVSKQIEVDAKNAPKRETEEGAKDISKKIDSMILGSLNALDRNVNDDKDVDIGIADVESQTSKHRRTSNGSTGSLDPLRIGEVLLDFLQVYGTEFNPAKDSVSLDLKALGGEFDRFVEMSEMSGILSVRSECRSSSEDSSAKEDDDRFSRTRHPRRPTPYTFTVHDPLRQSNNVTRTCFAISQIQHVFTQVLIQILLMGKNTTHVGGKSLLEDAGIFGRHSGSTPRPQI